jgi:hypothetical protein
MGSLWPVFAIILFVWFTTRRRRTRALLRSYFDMRDDEMDALNERIRRLERLMDYRDGRTRSDPDGL